MKLDADQSPRLDADRYAKSDSLLASGFGRGMYQRALAGWALDVLAVSVQPVVWSSPDDFADFRNRDWRQLYVGSILDD